MDVTEYVQGLQTPTLRVPRRGPLRWFIPSRTYRGRILSHVEWLPFQVRFAEVDRLRREESPRAEQELHETLAAYFDEIGIPARVVFGLPTAAVVAVMRDFLELQRKAMAPARSLTNGNVSRSRDSGGPLEGGKSEKVPRPRR